MPDKLLIVIVGPTAVGKTRVAVELAKNLNCAVINADSRQLFKEMTIGTAKPTMAEMEGVKHYFVNDRSISQAFSAGKFEKEALAVIDREFDQRNVCILSGGSGLYIDAVCLGLDAFPQVETDIRNELNRQLDELGVDSLYQELVKVDPEYANEIESNNSQRIIRALEIYRSSGITYSSLRTGMASQRNFAVLFIGLEMPRDELYDRINIRMDKMIKNGLFEEAIKLLPFRHKNALQTVGYNEVFLYHDGLIDKDEAIRLLKRNSRRYAKRQLTWFKRNKEVNWFHPLATDKILMLIHSKLHT
jgi:tRNA dimethylallyltransferase